MFKLLQRINKNLIFFLPDHYKVRLYSTCRAGRKYKWTRSTLFNPGWKL